MADLVAQVKERCYEDCENLNFQTTPIPKILILSVVTCGLYFVIWFYHYWKTLKQKFGLKISPSWRSLFSGVTVFRLFPMLEIYFKRFGIKFNNPSLWATLFFMLCYLSNQLYFRLSLSNANSIIVEIINYFLTFLVTCIIIMFQSNINAINKQYFPNAEVNKWKVSNTIWTIVFVAITILGYMVE